LEASRDTGDRKDRRGQSEMGRKGRVQARRVILMGKDIAKKDNQA